MSSKPVIPFIITKRFVDVVILYNGVNLDIAALNGGLPVNNGIIVTMGTNGKL